MFFKNIDQYFNIFLVVLSFTLITHATELSVDSPGFFGGNFGQVITVV